MGNKYTTDIFVNFQFVLNNKNQCILINTMSLDFQDGLIEYTIDASTETEIVNQLIEQNNKNSLIIIYGKNHTDLSVHEKSNQLVKFGFSNIKIYLGGMFEWLLLQEIYGKDEFPTSGRDLQMEILRYS